MADSQKGAVMYKLDLHTHSEHSPDGGITQHQYMKILEDGTLDYVAITDHDSVEFAKKMHKLLGKKVIVGSEIMSRQGEIIGLFLEKDVRPGMSAKQTAQDIKKQGGLVYIPHPFETVRSGISKDTLEEIAEYVDIVEAYNGRAFFQNKGPDAVVWAKLNNKPVAASSDAHGAKGVGSAFAVVKEVPNRSNLIQLISTAHLTMNRPPLRTLLYPKANRLKKGIKK